MKSKKWQGKRKQSAQIKVDWKALEIVHPDAAGIDVGGSEHWVAVNPERDAEPVRSFGCFTADLREMARWLVEKGCAVWPCNRLAFKFDQLRRLFHHFPLDSLESWLRTAPRNTLVILERS
jgi:hypothetical protein